MTTNRATQLFVGMDLHKNTSTFCVKDRDGAIVRQTKVLTDRNHITRFIRSFDQPLSLAVEPVSQWYTYADHLQGLGVDVHLAHPMRVKAIAFARIKTDTIDAGVLCDLLRSDLLPEAYFAPKEIRSWKELIRFRASLINLRTQVKNKVNAILHKHALKHPYSNLFGVAGTKWLRSLQFKEPFATALTEYLSLIDTLTEKINATEKQVEQMVTNHPQAKLLTSIPGISYVSALTIMAEIGDVRRFPSSKKLMGYAGLVPSTYASGDVVRHGRITKTGSKWLRYIMIEVAQHQQLCKRTPGFGSYYLALKQRKGSGPAAVATARKLLAVVWRLLKDNRPWQESPPDRGQARMRAANLSSPS
jgi:transposase